MTKLKENLILILAIFLFILLTVPFIATLPYMDGNIDFVQTIDFYSGGINQYFSNWNTVHPPVKLLIALPFYFLFGISSVSYSFPGILIGIAGIVGIYLLTKDLFDQKTANISALIFSAYPLMIANSIFFMRDYLLTVLIVISLFFFIKNKLYLYAIACSMAILTKESGLLIPILVIAVEIIEKIVKRKLDTKAIVNIIPMSIPLIVYFVWNLILSASNKNSWNEWIFTDTHGKGAAFTIINNLVTFKFLNPYAYEHWKQLLFLNFNWIYFVIIFFGLGIYLLKKRPEYKKRHGHNLKMRVIIVLFCLSYLLTVLSLQTYTIPRYALPLTPFLIIGLAKSITILRNLYFQITLIIIVFVSIIISLFFSVDPVATHLWGKNRIFDQKIYALNDQLAGNDGITYNIQYLLIAKNRSETILKASKEKKPVSSPYCRWIFPDPNNEAKMIKTLNIAINFDCINSN